MTSLSEQIEAVQQAAKTERAALLHSDWDELSQKCERRAQALEDAAESLRKISVHEH